ncbi:MAG: hypothetical protein HOC91_16665 [Nitrospinaceae bacterium]|nr:hypothetical protein [Nitrospinaceae bacterium]MBT4432144.1 hypothetical protein [Nitrospinaceae bacterium]MBT6394482.1 hypothetical protein [Nitrospinaceae bacterium]MBT7857693.1 hypothetical protein [Nitrospinaceae bacterium]
MSVEPGTSAANTAEVEKIVTNIKIHKYAQNSLRKLELFEFVLLILGGISYSIGSEK